MQHDYEQLGDRRFQQFCQSLLLAEYPELACLPVGMPDGGRDGLLAEAPSGSSDRQLLVLQVKFVERPDFLEDPTKWIEDILDGEREKVEALVRRGAERYVLATNVPGSSHLDDGSIDKVRAVLASALPIPAQCLWRADLDRRLEIHGHLKWSYPELMTGVDRLRALVEERPSEAGDRRTRALRAFLADQYRKDREVRFKQIDLRNDLLDVFIDVPARVQREHDEGPDALEQRVRTLARRDEADADEHRRIRYAHGAGSLLLDPWVQDRELKLVVEGAPGQGKSTMVQYVCQVHRIRLLAKSDDLARLPTEHCEGRVCVPIRMELRDLAQWLAGEDPFGAPGSASAPEQRTLEGFIVALVRSASGGANFDVGDLHDIAAVSPLLLALDGLDEVVDVGDRSQVVEEVSRAINRLSTVARSLQVVVTTRPASFTTGGRFAAPFQYVMLVSITRRLIGVYRDRWLSARDLELSEERELSTTLDEKLAQPHFRDLCRNPMQLAIVLSLLHRKGPALPEQRTDLYRSYMEYFLDREATKSRAVRDHRELLLLLHGHIACLLHIEAERSSRRAGRIRTDDLVTAAEDFVASRGHPRDLFRDLFGGVFDRFGALVSRVQDTFEFEVQPLREYFAGFYLYETAPYSPVGRERTGTRPERLDAMLRHHFWLNVARFYAGCYSVGELESLAGRLEALADDDELCWTGLPRTVTAQLLADWTLVQDRRAHKRAVAVMLRGLGTRHAASGENSEIANMGEVPFVLPANSGGSELVDALFDAAMEPSIQGPRLTAVVRALMANAPTIQLAERWLTAKPVHDADEDSPWWKIGTTLAVFRGMSRTQIAKFLEPSSTRSARLSAVVSSGVFWPADESRKNGSAAIDYLLSGGSFVYGVATDHPLLALHAVVNVDRVALAEVSGLYYYFDEDWTLPAGDWPEHYNKARAIAGRYDAWRQQRCRWAMQLKPWLDIVDGGRALFGERDAFDRLALLSSGVRDASQRGGGHPELHDCAKSLVLRARYARYRARTPDWWRDQIDSAPDARSERIAITLALAWARSATIATLQPELSGHLDAMTSDRYAQLCVDLEDVARLHRATRQRAPSAKVDAPSPRLFAALESRISDRDSRELYRLAAYDDDQRDRPVLALFLRLELELIEKERAPGGWDTALRLLRQMVQIEAPELPYRLVSRALRMPDDVALEIVRDAGNYPLAAVQAAESRLALVAARKMPRVGDVAQRDRWFGEDH